MRTPGTRTATPQPPPAPCPYRQLRRVPRARIPSERACGSGQTHPRRQLLLEWDSKPKLALRFRMACQFPQGRGSGVEANVRHNIPFETANHGPKQTVLEPSAQNGADLPRTVDAFVTLDCTAPVRLVIHDVSFVAENAFLVGNPAFPNLVLQAPECAADFKRSAR